MTQYPLALKDPKALTGKPHWVMALQHQTTQLSGHSSGQRTRSQTNPSGTITPIPHKRIDTMKTDVL